MNAVTASKLLLRVGLLSAAPALALLPMQVSAQQMDHAKMHMPMPAEKPAPQETCAQEDGGKSKTKIQARTRHGPFHHRP